MLDNSTVIPKRKHSSQVGRSTWYPYYAGFSDRFVHRAISELENWPSHALDPWLGSGTTTQVASELGIQYAGVDLNPVMVVVAKARLLSPSSSNSIQPLKRDILSKAETLDIGLEQDDPLAQWLIPTSARQFRHLVASISKTLVERESPPHNPFATTEIDQLSDLAAFFLVAAFRTIRALLQEFVGSNPTWMRLPTNCRYRLRPSATRIYEMFQASVDTMLEHFEPTFGCTLAGRTSGDIRVANAASLPYADAAFDAIITSPPYLTRIDYAMATKAELAVLGIGNGKELNALRQSLSGTTAIHHKTPSICAAWGTTCTNLLAEIQNHSSHASSTYYLKTFLQYFDSIYRSLREVTRVAAIRARAAIVVQDSYYKELYIDLPRIFEEQLKSLGWMIVKVDRHACRHSMENINRGSRQYRQATGAVESTIVACRS